MWRVACRYRPNDDYAQQWLVVQSWSVRGQTTYKPVKVERKNPRRKRLILLAPMRIHKGQFINPATILRSMLASMPNTEKLRHIREGLA